MFETVCMDIMMGSLALITVAFAVGALGVLVAFLSDVFDIRW